MATERGRRVLFKKQFGEKLIPQGFKYKEGCFVRVHPGQVVLVVELEIAPSGNCYICYGAVPFCDGIQSAVKNRWQRVEAFLKKDKCIRWPLDYNRQCQAFFEHLYPPFIKIESVKDLIDFQNWQSSVLGFCAHKRSLMREYIQIRNFVKAKEYALAVLEDNRFAKLRHLEAKEYHVKYAKAQKDKDRYIALYDALLDKVIADIEDLERQIALMDAKQYEELSREIEEKIVLSTEMCEKLYPEFYE